MESILNLVLSDHAAFAITDASSVAVARRGALDAARRVGLNEVDSGRVALVITEAATNILKHAGQGEILVRPLFATDSGKDLSQVPAGRRNAASAAAVELIALDNGVGIADLNAAFKDGYSSTETSGTGLGAMRRLSDDLAIYSQVGFGTAIRLIVQVRLTHAERSMDVPDEQHASTSPRWGDRNPPDEIDVGSIGVPYPGEEVCGDAWSLQSDATGVSLLVVDGLGHGPLARQAAAEAVNVFQSQPDRSPGDLLELMHRALGSTRGAAAAVARIDFKTRRVVFAGIGNIAASVSGMDPTSADKPGYGALHPNHSRSTRQLASHNGIVGHGMRKSQEFTVPWLEEGTLIMHSDGLATRWDLSKYPGLSNQRAALIASVLYRDFSRRNDDATVVVVKMNHH